jgi:hypothetical protein
LSDKRKKIEREPSTALSDVPDGEEALLGGLADDLAECTLLVGRQDAARELGEPPPADELANAARPEQVGPEAEDASHAIRKGGFADRASGSCTRPVVACSSGSKGMAVRGRQAGSRRGSRDACLARAPPTATVVSPTDRGSNSMFAAPAGTTTVASWVGPVARSSTVSLTLSPRVETHARETGGFAVLEARLLPLLAHPCTSLLPLVEHLSLAFFSSSQKPK